MPGWKRESELLAFCSLFISVFPEPGTVYAVKGILIANNICCRYESTREEMRKLRNEVRDREHEIKRRQKAMEEEFEKMDEDAAGSN